MRSKLGLPHPTVPEAAETDARQGESALLIGGAFCWRSIRAKEGSLQLRKLPAQYSREFKTQIGHHCEVVLHNGFASRRNYLTAEELEGQESRQSS